MSKVEHYGSSSLPLKNKTLLACHVHPQHEALSLPISTSKALSWGASFWENDLTAPSNVTSSLTLKIIGMASFGISWSKMESHTFILAEGIKTNCGYKNRHFSENWKLKTLIRTEPNPIYFQHRMIMVPLLPGKVRGKGYFRFGFHLGQ